MLSLVLPPSIIFMFMVFVAIPIGRSHSLGAWLGMWRAGKLSWVFVFYIIFVLISIYILFFKIIPTGTAVFISQLLFIVHFIFDEFELQEEKKILSSVFLSFTPAILSIIFITQGFFGIKTDFSLFFLIALMLFTIELLFLKEINWFFVDTKVLSFFVLAAIYLGKTPHFIFITFLAFHYFFWFIYPVYKLHKYKREERDGFIMALLIIVFSSIFLYSGTPFVLSSNNLTFLKIFYAASTVHILTTAPFAYLFGFPRPKKYE